MPCSSLQIIPWQQYSTTHLKHANTNWHSGKICRLENEFSAENTWNILQLVHYHGQFKYHLSSEWYVHWIMPDWLNSRSWCTSQILQKKSMALEAEIPETLSSIDAVPSILWKTNDKTSPWQQNTSFSHKLISRPFTKA